MVDTFASNIESAQKIYLGRGECEMHANQFWWTWLLWFWRFYSFLFYFKFGQISISDHGGRKIKLAQNIRASRGQHEMHANQF